MGYHRAGFDVVGVDIVPQPHYPFRFVQVDALHYLAGHLDASSGLRFAAIHASPPCQFATTMSVRHRGRGMLADSRVDLLTPTLKCLEHVRIPWVVENVPGAKRLMPSSAIRLTGGMFGLGVERPRLFASSVALFQPPRARVLEPVGVYGKAHDGRLLWRRKDGTEQHAASSLAEAQEAMGMDWADWYGTKEAIPPAYTEFIGRQLLDADPAAATEPPVTT